MVNVTPYPPYRRDPAKVGLVQADPAILCGKPCIAGTRISVELVLEELSAGLGVQDLLEMYPHLQAEDIFGVLRYALGKVRRESEAEHARAAV